MSQAGPLDRLLALQHLGIKFGLDNIRILCEALSHPERRFRSVIVGGTNGKGSVTAMVEHGLRAAGYRTARYTSPHLVRLEERFSILGREVASAALLDITDEVLSLADSLVASGALAVRPTFFEVTTAIAFVLFARAEVEYAVLEVGLGGRFDATNVVTPVAAAITTIDLDHQQFLGTTIESIAFEKAGIIKSGIPVIVGEVKDAAVSVIRRICDERGAQYVDGWKAVAVSRVGDLVQIRTPKAAYGPLRLALAGDHQIANAVVAVRLLEHLSTAERLSTESISAGLEHVQWPGRLQWITCRADRRLLVDAAHNPAGAAALARFLAQTFTSPMPIVLAVMRDKDIEGIVAALRPHAAAFIVTRPAIERAADPRTLISIVRRVAPGVPAEIASTPATALDVAFAKAPTVCACGSIFLIGELLTSGCS